MLTPTDIKKYEIEQCNLEQLEKDIDEEIKKNHGNYKWEEALLNNEYSVAVRNAIGRRYMENGWKCVYHQTSSENGEKPGLTHFVFSELPIQHFENNSKYMKIHKVVDRNIFKEFGH